VRRYAQQYPQQVGALVLVDPPEQGADDLLPAAGKAQGEAAIAQRNALLDACLQAAGSAALDRAGGPLASCLRAPPAWQSAPVAAATRAYKLKPGYWRTLRSELEANGAIFAPPVPADESHGDLPVVVLAAPAGNGGMPEDVAAALHDARERTRARLVASSRQAGASTCPGPRTRSSWTHRRPWYRRWARCLQAGRDRDRQPHPRARGSNRIRRLRRLRFPAHPPLPVCHACARGWQDADRAAGAVLARNPPGVPARPPGGPLRPCPTSNA